MGPPEFIDWVEFLSPDDQYRLIAILKVMWGWWNNSLRLPVFSLKETPENLHTWEKLRSMEDFIEWWYEQPTNESKDIGRLPLFEEFVKL